MKVSRMLVNPRLHRVKEAEETDAALVMGLTVRIEVDS